MTTQVGSIVGAYVVSLEPHLVANAIAALLAEVGPRSRVAFNPDEWPVPRGVEQAFSADGLVRIVRQWEIGRDAHTYRFQCLVA